MKTVTCLYPYTSLAIHCFGRVYCCCPRWTKIGPIGNLHTQSIEKIWNSSKIQNLRARLLEGKLGKTCKAEYCDFLARDKKINLTSLAKNKIYRPVIREIQKGKPKISTWPLELTLAHSGVCNLRCRMCTSNEDYRPFDEKLTKKIFRETLPKLLPHLYFIKLTGNGEPFAQPEVVNFLKKFKPSRYPHLKFRLLTNGLLLNKRMWQRIKHNQIESISVSIDAACQTTYEKIRKDGGWKILQNNLKMISQLRKREEINYFEINFVVMRSNYQEMADFVRMGKHLGCDSVYFQKIYGFQGLEENINFFKDTEIIRRVSQILEKPALKRRFVKADKMSNYRNCRSSWKERLGWYRLKLSFYKIIFRLFKKPLVSLLKNKFIQKGIEFYLKKFRARHTFL